MGATDAFLGALGAMSGGVYLLVTCVDVKAAGGIRRFVRTEAKRVEDAVESEIDAVRADFEGAKEQPIADADAS